MSGGAQGTRTGQVILNGFALENFLVACNNVNGGWCSHVQVQSEWLDRNRTAWAVDAFIGLCLPFSCCDDDACNMQYGLSAVVQTALQGTVNRWCTGSEESLSSGSAAVPCPANGTQSLAVASTALCRETSFEFFLVVLLALACGLVVTACLAYSYRLFMHRRFGRRDADEDDDQADSDEQLLARRGACLPPILCSSTTLSSPSSQAC